MVSQKESGQFRTGHCHIGTKARDEKRKKKGQRERVVTCPECSTCYPDNGLHSCPELCTSRRLSTQQICGRRLRKSRNIHSHSHDIPVRPFLYHDFKEWLGEMLCRPGMEDMMDRSFSPSPDGIMGDIWDAPSFHIHWHVSDSMICRWSYRAQQVEVDANRPNHGQRLMRSLKSNGQVQRIRGRFRNSCRKYEKM